MDDIIGHEPIRQFFDTVIQHDRMHHAYCFVGKKHLGKATLAKALAKTLAGIPPHQHIVHPDVLIVEKEKHTKTGKTKKHIDVAQIQHVRTFAKGKPLMAKKKMVIIDGAEELNTTSSNALLKTLEEPSGYTIFFLITTSAEALLETIQSRCHMMYFHEVSKNTIEQALTREGVQDAKEIARASRGLPGLAIDWAKDHEAFTTYKEFVEQFKGLVGKPLYEKCQSIESLFGDKTDHIAQRAMLKDVLDTWQIALREEYGKRPWTKDHTLQTYNQIKHAQRGLMQNIHPRLLIEHVLLAMP